MAKQDFDPNLRTTTLRLLITDLMGAKKIARVIGMPYQRWIRDRVHEAVEAKLAEMRTGNRRAVIR